MKTASAGMELRHGGSSASFPAGYHTVNMMQGAITSKTACICRMLFVMVLCSDVMVPFCCKYFVLFDVLSKLEDGIIDF